LFTVFFDGPGTGASGYTFTVASSDELTPSLPLALLRSARAEQSAAFEIEREVWALFDRHSLPLTRYVRSFGLTTACTEDVIQETFLALVAQLRRGRAPEHVKAWLFQVAHNHALRQRRTALRRRENPLDLLDLSIVASGPSPEQRLLTAARRRQLRRIFLALPERDQRCLYLRAEGLQYREIANVMHMSLGSVAKSLTRSMAKLAVGGQG
jgi:RNA polymerase sigma-70 factor (ECF subfamily)